MDITTYQLQRLSNIIRVEDGNTRQRQTRGEDEHECKETGCKLKEGPVSRGGEQSDTDEITVKPIGNPESYPPHWRNLSREGESSDGSEVTASSLRNTDLMSASPRRTFNSLTSCAACGLQLAKQSCGFCVKAFQELSSTSAVCQDGKHLQSSSSFYPTRSRLSVQFELLTILYLNTKVSERVQSAHMQQDLSALRLLWLLLLMMMVRHTSLMWGNILRNGT